MASNDERITSPECGGNAQSDGAAPAPHPDRSAAAATSQPQVITIALPTGMGALSGFGAVFSALFLFAAWCLVGIGYFCVPGSFAAGAVGIVVGFMNIGNGLAAAAISFGCGLSCFGLCLPLLVGTNALRRLVLRASRRAGAALKQC